MVKIDPIPAFDDNYIWLLSNRESGSAAVVDPGDEAPVLESLRERGLNLEAILITHKHGDHVGGVGALREAFPGAEVYGPLHEKIRGITRPLKQGDRVRLTGTGAEFQVLDVPGHTEGHIAYYDGGVLFCGDTLFAAGCGRVFSGTPEQLYESLRRIAALPPETLIYCAHEYTLDNLGFARWVEPDNPDLLDRQTETESLRARNRPTVPSTLRLELRSNPFLRTDQPVVVVAAERYAGKRLGRGAEVFTMIRNWKDREYD